MIRSGNFFPSRGHWRCCRSCWIIQTPVVFYLHDIPDRNFFFYVDMRLFLLALLESSHFLHGWFLISQNDIWISFVFKPLYVPISATLDASYLRLVPLLPSLYIVSSSLATKQGRLRHLLSYVLFTSSNIQNKVDSKQKRLGTQFKAAYLKSGLPFYGSVKPQLRRILTLSMSHVNLGTSANDIKFTNQ